MSHLPLKKRIVQREYHGKNVDKGHDQPPNDVNPESQKRHSSQGDKQAAPYSPVRSRVTGNREEVHQHKRMKIDKSDLDYLFEMELSPRDVGSERLKIPTETAETHFPRLRNSHSGLYKQETRTLPFLDAQKTKWWMDINFSPLTNSYAISGDWRQFAYAHDLQHRDTVRFFKLVNSDNRYFIDYVRAGEEGNGNEKMGKYLFEKCLSRSDVNFSFLYIPKEAAETHFPPIEKSPGNYAKGIVWFCYGENEDWEMEFNHGSNTGGYRISGNWAKFVKDHQLEANDVIVFSKAEPDSDENPYRYQIRIQRNK